MLIEANGKPITSPQSWLSAAPPKGGLDHWVAGRSARELAEAWCGEDGPCIPTEIHQLLQSHQDLVDIAVTHAYPERRIRFDDLRGEPRNADLAIKATDLAGVIGITVEGKADEAFDRPVSAVLQSAAKRIGEDVHTGAISRIEMLSAALLPPWHDGLPHLGDLRYQLLTGVAGTIAWAREIGASRAAFLVHEFVTANTRDENHARNAADLNTFLSRLTGGAVTGIASDQLIGPFRISGNSHLPSTIPLYLGKVSRRIRP